MTPEEATRLFENVRKGAEKGHKIYAASIKEQPSAPYIKEATTLKKKGNGDKAKGEMELVIKAMFPDYKKEYKFAEDRKFRFDFMVRIVDEKNPEKVTLCGIEYEGVFGSEKSRHTAPISYTQDARKYNLAQVLGYIVLRYTAASHTEMGSDLWQLKYPIV